MNLTYNNEAQAKIRLTNEINSCFKILFDYRVEDNYKISTIDTVKHPYEDRAFYSKEKNALRKALLDFIEDATSKTYTEVGKEYGRKRDENDIAIDAEYNEEFPIDHYSLSNKKGIIKKARIHGYIRNGVFVVRRVDWGHNFHPRKEKYLTISSNKKQ